MSERVVIGNAELYLADCLKVLPTLAANSVDLIAVDPPYYKVKDDAWDRQWDTPAGFLAWIGQLCEQWERILKPNGSLYVFASPRMAARVECKIGETFNILNTITWAKRAGRSQQAEKEALRSFFPDSERIIFAEHYGADNIAKGETGYAAKCDQLRGFIFEPLRAYLDGERQRAGITPEQCNEICGHRIEGGMAGRHYFSISQWCLPTEANYLKLREGFHRLNHGGDYLRREYEDLRREYEDLRRPFAVTADVPYTDVWTFPTVSAYEGKHPCEKPLAMMEHIVRTSTRPNAVVLDCCMGSGTTGIAALNLGRRFVGVEMSEHWHSVACRRIAAAQAQLRLPFAEIEAAQ